MEKILNNKGWIYGAVQINVETPTIPTIRGNIDKKLQKCYVKTKFCINTTSGTSEMYEFKIDLFDNGDTEEFLLFQRNYQITIESTGSITMGEKIQYVHTWLLGEYLLGYETLYKQTGNSNTTHLNQILFGLGTYFYDQYIFKEKQRNVPRNEEDAQDESHVICSEYD